MTLTRFSRRVRKPGSSSYGLIHREIVSPQSSFDLKSKVFFCFSLAEVRVEPCDETRSIARSTRNSAILAR
jgi:hypothetical protein